VIPVDYLDGVILHQLAFPNIDFDPAQGIHDFFAVMVGR